MILIINVSGQSHEVENLDEFIANFKKELELAIRLKGTIKLRIQGSISDLIISEYTLADSGEPVGDDSDYDLIPHPDYGDLMTIGTWLATVKSGGFIDYDGYGRLATNTHMSGNIDDEVSPSDTENMERFKEQSKNWTHIMWFNK